MIPLRTIATRARGYLRGATYIDPGAIRIDTRALAAFRIAAGLLIVADILLRFRNFTFFYTETGVVPQSLATEMTADNAFSVYYFTTDSTVIAALFALTILIAIQLIVGYKTRIATVLSFLLVVSLDHHNPLVLSFADTLFRMLLFWAMFLPLGERWSVDAVHADSSPRTGITSLASAAILAQVVYMYVLNGYHKRESELWTGGEATPLIMGLDNTTFLLGELMRNVPTLLQYGGVTWYYMLLFAWLLILLRGNTRAFFVAMFIAGHASFAITVRIGAFPYVAMAGLLLFLQAPVWDRLEALVRSVTFDGSRLAHVRTELERLGSRLPRARIDSKTLGHVRTTVYTIALVVAVVSLLVVPTLSYLPVAQFVDEEDGPKDRIDDRADTIRVSQPDWTVFAPHPRTVDRYYVFPAETEGGDTVDAYNERPVTHDRPSDELQKQFDTYRERFYMNSVRRGGPDDIVVETLAEHLCETWADDHGEELTHVNAHYVAEDVTLETIDEPADRDREIESIYYHGCGDNEPDAIEPPE
ncbi:HTTM domain-containing protein [Natronolimnohabitans sp. A-GB9]|uniref:HTTM domain-containing protein n=1 Tax=Natronolimnohabitans sp. A-GB9 TaxID=3069757 RepID=UPI0027AF406E|nr:HTTM domain-containing protein [Natronolimnohabitans sp. A-GB9]MDQ2050572.1 HTTM domain-containing protein [Natronolimnohabitans sp. A-GB9]